MFYNAHKTTKKEVMANYKNVIKVNYCKLQNLLKYEEREAYTTRPEGWGADIYRINSDTCICTGYAPFGNIYPDQRTINKFEKEAKAFDQDPFSLEYNYTTRKEVHNQIIKDFINSIE